jgi:hypothetical protein
MKVGDTWIPFWRAYLECHFTSRSRSGIEKALASSVGDSGPLWNYDSTTQNIYFSGEQAWNQAGGSFGMAPDWGRGS